MASVPCQDHRNKIMEGSARRQKLLFLDGGTIFAGKNERESQWIKCWMVIFLSFLKSYLYIQTNHR